MKPQEQRQHPRIKPPKSVIVAWQCGTQRDVCYVENLALGGLYVRTKKKVPLRGAVQILLDMPVGQVRGRAVVRRLAEHGMGIQIIAMDPSDRARLQQQLRELPASA
ncbi:MAG TPA: PilZ domain-containing protein [Candidatus Acidoferrum sp.]